MLTRLPPLNAIRAFHAASRHLNFSKAAEELGVTQSAISKQILLLEDFVGTQLFERSATGLTLTKEGNSLKSAVWSAFDQLGAAFSRFERRAPRAARFRISTLASFASMFLIRRLDAFREAFPGTELEILASERLVDLQREEIDFTIRYGHGHWEGLEATKLAPPALVPVCHPALAEKLPNDDIEALLKTHRRIQIFSRNEWKIWSEHTGHALDDASEVFIMEDFLVAMNAVLAEQGLALMPEILIRDHLSAGRLVQFGAAYEHWDQTYYIARRAGGRQRHMVDRVIDWLQSEANPPAE